MANVLEKHRVIKVWTYRILVQKIDRKEVL